MSAEERALIVIDDALVRLRRLWSSTRQAVVDPAGRRVDMSSVLVVEACTRAVRGAETSIGDVARFADVEASTASRLVDRAVRAGLVRRAPSAADARRTTLQLTADGHRLRARAVEFRLAWLRGLVGDWPSADVEDLAALLDRFATAVVVTGPPDGGTAR